MQSGLVDGLHIRQILPPSGLEFGGYEAVAGNKTRCISLRQKRAAVALWRSIVMVT
jgi:hypothetical protein